MTDHMAESPPATNTVGIHHVGITVPNLVDAISFFEHVFGCRTVMRFDKNPAAGEWLGSHVGAHPDSVIAGLAILRCGDGTNLELIEFRRPTGIGDAPRLSTHSSTHIAVQVHDLEMVTARFRTGGGELLCGPNLIKDGDLAGLHWIYGRTPWGLLVELVSVASALGYTQRTADRLWQAES